MVHMVANALPCPGSIQTDGIGASLNSHLAQRTGSRHCNSYKATQTGYFTIEDVQCRGNWIYLSDTVVNAAVDVDIPKAVLFKGELWCFACQ